MAFNKNLVGHHHYVAKAISQNWGTISGRNNIFTLVGDDWADIQWDEDNPDPCPTEAEVTAKAEELRVADNYRLPRKLNYPTVKDQLDMLFHDMTSDKGSKTGEWYKTIAKVKSDNPKP